MFNRTIDEYGKLIVKLEAQLTERRIYQLDAEKWRTQYKELDKRIIDARPLAELGELIAADLDTKADTLPIRKGADVVTADRLRDQADMYRKAAQALAPTASVNFSNNAYAVGAKRWIQA